MPNLPDLDMAISVMDESRILTPREMIDKYVKIEQERRELLAPELAMTKYSSRQDIDNQKPETFDPGWISDDASLYWNYFRETCPTDSPSRNISALEFFNVPVEYPSEQMPYAYRGFVQNFTQARDPCLQPHLRGLQGTFVESVSMSTTTTLFPLFAGSKLPTNNELLIPAAMYLSRRAFYSGGRGSGGKWSTKRNALIWRGTASGSRNKADNWWRFHRHRWMQMMNGTAVARVEAGDAASAPTFDLLSAANYSLPRAMGGQIGAWLSNFSDVQFVHLECFPEPPKERKGTCSGRWRAFLKSTSVPLKATIYAEWHDDRMVPWVHFVPFDASYKDIYAVMEYLLDGRNAQAEVIATESSNWANAVYRDEDMKLYVWRLLLEHARVVDDNRQRLAFVDDLRKEE
ncbi:Lipopolysaccharide-modifying protein [Akanthomyces lecanii RCEF 1005]|uniref:Lipopolysaccharide-modifying protein n=1 Tax=Akanthomyces lecanii RCEF 1005 TaxID=1081108 RepID=A0A168H0G4_CORDF|nr:Lipopolysaccharide-modifying protein [Akanthomyces lecanii RCEF 1005]